MCLTVQIRFPKNGAHAGQKNPATQLLNTPLDFRYSGMVIKYLKKRCLTWRNFGYFTNKFTGLQTPEQRALFYHQTPILSSPFWTWLYKKLSHHRAFQVSPSYRSCSPKVCQPGWLNTCWNVIWKSGCCLLHIIHKCPNDPLFHSTKVQSAQRPWQSGARSCLKWRTFRSLP